MTDDEVTRMWRVRKTVCSMLEKRGYLVADDDLKMSKDKFKDNYYRGDTGSVDRDKMSIISTSKTNTEDKMGVFFVYSEDPRKKIGVQPIKDVIDRMEKHKIKNAILIVAGGITPYAKQVIQTVRQEDTYVDMFKEAELMVNITEHMLVPEHHLLTPDEKSQLLARYHLKETQLPRIQQADPVARFYGFKRGQVIKIVRPSETAGKYVTYRLVV